MDIADVARRVYAKRHVGREMITFSFTDADLCDIIVPL